MIAISHYQIIFWLCAGATAVASMLPVEGSQVFESQDKVGHALIYALLYFFGVRAYGHSISLWLLAILILLFGLSIEIAQSMTSYRHGDILDLVANGVGITSIWLLLELRRRTV